MLSSTSVAFQEDRNRLMSEVDFVLTEDDALLGHDPEDDWPLRIILSHERAYPLDLIADFELTQHGPTY
jgi:hypothetical protein